MNHLKLILFVIYLLSLVIFLIGLTGRLYPSNQTNLKFQKLFILSEQSSAFKEWSSDSNYHRFEKFYFFHVNNSEALINGQSDYPLLQEKGPYTFKVISKKEIISLNSSSNLATYVIVNQYIYDKSQSIGALEDIIITANLPLIYIINSLKDYQSDSWSWEESKLFYDSVISSSKEEAFIAKSVKQWLFDGFEVSLINELSKLNIYFPNNTFGYLYKKNNSRNDFWTINTGESDYNKLKQIQLINNQSSLKCWNGPDCDIIKGTDGSFFPIPIDSLSKLYFYEPWFNRSFYFTYERSMNQNGFNYFRFVLSNTSFGAPLHELENSCYCTRNELVEQVEGFCTEDGILDISSCNDNKPLFASAPHFYQGSELLLSRTKLKPNKFLHQTFMDIDPTTGLVLAMVKRFQLNIQIVPVDDGNKLKDISSLMIPIFWREESFKVNLNLMSTVVSLQSASNNPSLYNFLIVIGLIIMLLLLLMLLKTFVFDLVNKTFVD